MERKIHHQHNQVAHIDVVHQASSACVEAEQETDKYRGERIRQCLGHRSFSVPSSVFVPLPFYHRACGEAGFPDGPGCFGE